VVRKKFSRSQLLRFTAKLQVRLIGMEACGGAHYLGRALRDQGHDVRLMPAQYVKPFMKTNKNDYIDAEAIAEAVGRPRMRYVPIKSEDQLDMQSLHRVRARWVKSRTSLVNQIRGLLLERGITIRKGRRHAEATLPAVLEDAEINLSGTLRLLLAQPLSELRQLTSQIEDIDATIQRGADEQEACQRLMAIPGVGPITAAHKEAGYICADHMSASFFACSKATDHTYRVGDDIPAIPPELCFLSSLELGLWYISVDPKATPAHFVWA
jgi:transposase